jgi:hypothetical protein
MIKRILTAIVVFPVSFVIVSLLTYFLVTFVAGVFYIQHINVLDSFTNPPGFAQDIQDAAQKAETDYYQNPQAFENTTSDAMQGFLKLHGADLRAFAVIFALVAAIIFFLSCLADKLYVALLISRRIVTVPLIFGYGFLVAGGLIYFATTFICVMIAQAASVPEKRIEAVAQFHKDYDGMVALGVMIAAVLVAIYLSYRLTRWDGLPWCSAPRPVQSPHRSRRTL